MPPAKPIVLPAIQVSLPPHINPVWTRPTIIKPDKEIKGLRRSELRGEDSIKACCWRKVIAGRSLNQIAIDLKSSDDGHVMKAPVAFAGECRKFALRPHYEMLVGNANAERTEMRLVEQDLERKTS